jgi:hypothetical protein
VIPSKEVQIFREVQQPITKPNNFKDMPGENGVNKAKIIAKALNAENGEGGDVELDEWFVH